MYMLGSYIVLATAYALLSNLTVTTLNIIFGLGLILSGVLYIPAIISTDSGSSTSSNIFISTVFSYPIVYLISLICSRWVPVIEKNESTSIFIAALPLINILVFILLILVLIIKEKIKRT
ncbi:MAG: hypothetical protein DIZ80_10685 [endosymbiont of Galathealinum brachiosum]|uniref:Uncharacterized protein n=1 Tax=endosymbiont of Galathealinum brachiosum TaxID=2200906 RepID=A0A370DEK6_9GAMM|nr:MAG: hypothetical protein DIZ80_10685 [endosymbiont of Galathealinum brachiosum]